MSKTKTLFTMALLVLLGSMGAAQAQETANYAEVKLFTTPADYARKGGTDEVVGSILLSASDQAAIEVATATITLHFSAPLAANITETDVVDDQVIRIIGGTATVAGTAENADNDDNGTIVFSGIMFSRDTSNNLLIQGVRLNVSGADGAITVTVDATPGPSDFIRIDGPSSAMVISDIKVGVEASATAVTVRTRGTDAGGVMASLTLKESFGDAFMDGNMVTVEFSGIPEGVKLAAMVTSNHVEDDNEETMDMITMDTPYASVSMVEDGSATVTLGGEADMQAGRPAPASVTLELTLTAISSNANISFPMDRGSVMAKATFTDPTGVVDDFADAFTDYVTVFNIRPAQCTLLFPVVSVLPMSSLGPWDTAISVTNPAYTKETADGGLTFTFYAQADDNGDIPLPAEFNPSPDGPGTGLSLDGNLAAGSTYQVLASQILDYTNWGARFVGHVHVLADYTNCSGLGWVTNFIGGVNGGINQAYTATVIDADTGTNNTK